MKVEGEGEKVSSCFTRRCFIGAVAAAVATRSRGVFAAESPILKIGVLSDPHIRTDPASAGALRKEFARFSHEGVRAVVISGDLCEVGTLTELKNLTNAWQEAFPGGRNAAGETVEPIVAFGNHDYHDASYLKAKPISEEDRKLGILFNKDAAWKMLTGRSFEGEIYRRDIAGVTFIAAHWTHFDQELADWLTAHKDEIPTDRPVFFVQHSHPRSTCFGKWYKASSTVNFETLMKHPNFFVISGHSHIANTYEDAIWQGGFVSMAAGGASGSGGRRYEYNVGVKPADVAKRGVRHMPPQDSGVAQIGSIVTVYPSRVTVSRWDHLHDEHVGEDWDLAFPFRHDAAHPFAIAESAAAPEFPVGAKIAVEEHEGLIYPTQTSARQVSFTFPCAASVGPHSRVVDYRVEIVRAETGEKVIERLVAQNLISLSESRTLKEPGRCVFGRDEMPEHVKLRVKVTPLNAGGKGGKQIQKEFMI